MSQIVRSRGVIARREHPELAGAIDHLIVTGRLVAVLPGVYARAPVEEFDVRIRAAMAWHPDAVLVGAAAARSWFWPTLACPAVDVALPRRTVVRRGGFRFCRRPIPPELVAEWSGIRMTVPALTALDLCATLGGDAIDVAFREQAVSLADLERALELTPNRRGNQLCRELVEESREQPWSPPERRLHRLLRAAGLAGWRGNIEVVGPGWLCHPDVAFEDVLLAVEVDGRTHHNTVAAFERDHQRQNRLVRSGWTVLRFTPTMIDTDPEGVVATIEETLGRLGGDRVRTASIHHAITRSRSSLPAGSAA